MDERCWVAFWRQGGSTMEIEIGRTLSIEDIIQFGILRHSVYKQEIEVQKQEIQDAQKSTDVAHPEYFPVEHRLDLRA
jgi:hypothetical protein